METTGWVKYPPQLCPSTHGGAGYVRGDYWDDDVIVCCMCGTRIRNPRPTGYKLVKSATLWGRIFCGKKDTYEPTWPEWIVGQRGIPREGLCIPEGIPIKMSRGVGREGEIKIDESKKLLFREEAIREVPKVWGREVWLVNRPEYCAKFLYLDACAVSSLHRHLKKTETFYALENRCTLWVEGQLYDMNPKASPVTILPGQWHEFTGPVNGVAKILEVSTHDSPEDSIRLTESKPGKTDATT